MLNLETLFEEAELEVLMHEPEWQQGMNEVCAGHKKAVKSFVSLFEDYKITSEEARKLISFADEMARVGLTPQELFKSGSLSESTYRMLTGQYGSFEPLK